nr:nitrogen permease regulator 3 protein [Hymenolepis microstoma]
MASLNSSVIFWNEEEIMPRSILLISSGAVGDRLLFWQSTISPQNSFQQDSSESRFKSQGSTDSHTPVNSPQGINSTVNTRGVLCSSPAVGVAGTPVSSLVIGSPHQSAGSVSTGSGVDADVAKSRPTAQRHSLAATITPSNVSSPTTPVAVSGYVSGVSGTTGSGPGTSAVAPTEMIVEDVPVSSLLSLLHPATNELQHKIYVKLSAKIFVGVAFSLTKAVMETNGISVVTQSSPSTNRRHTADPTSAASSCSATTPVETLIKQSVDFASISNFLHLKVAPSPPLGTECCSQAPHCSTLFGNCGVGKAGAKTVNQSVSSFAIVFALNEAAPPCVQSHFTELARQVGAQIRRSELFWQNLSGEREKISAILDRYAGILSGGESQSESNSLGAEVKNEGVDTTVSSSTTPNNETIAMGLSTSNSPLMNSHKRTSIDSNVEEDDSNLKLDKRKDAESSSHCDPWHVYGHIAKKSQLCGELVKILTQVTSSGRVNVKIFNKYSVFFCLPFKAYGIMPFGMKMITSPRPCWPAIRPGAVWRAMQRLRPYHTLLLTTRKRFLHSYTGSFPKDVNQSLESFVEDLSPLSSLASMSNRGHSQEDCLKVALWLVYHGHAIIISPIVSTNAYTLAPLSHYWLQPKVIVQFAAQFPKLNFAEVLSSFSDYYTLGERYRGESPANFWSKLSSTECADLVAWLLRRRLIIQLHTYILPLFPRPGVGKPSEAAVEGLNDTTESEFVGIHVNCGGELLQKALPTEAARNLILEYYRKTIQRYPDMLYLFLRLLSHLPAHIEELMFLEFVDRRTLINCLQLFSTFLITVRLPDPVTACFAGVEWSH